MNTKQRLDRLEDSIRKLAQVIERLGGEADDDLIPSRATANDADSLSPQQALAEAFQAAIDKRRAELLKK